MAEFEDLMQRIVGDEADRTALYTLATKYPALKSSVMAQEDYSRRLDQFRTDEEELGAWRRWKVGGKDPKTGQVIEGQWDAENNRTKSETVLRQQLDDVTTKVRELEAMGGGDMNFDDVVKELGTRGYMTSAEFETRVKPTIVDRDFYSRDIVQRLSAQGGIYENVMSDTSVLQMQHARDFEGEILEPKKLWKFMADNSLGADVNAAYAKMYEPRLNELRDRQAKSREETIRNEEREKVRLELAQGNQGRGNPVDNTGSSRVMGHLEAKRVAAAKGNDSQAGMEGAELGAGTIAAIAAEQYRKDPAAFAGKP